MPIAIFAVIIIAIIAAAGYFFTNRTDEVNITAPETDVVEIIEPTEPEDTTSTTETPDTAAEANAAANTETNTPAAPATTPTPAPTPETTAPATQETIETPTAAEEPITTAVFTYTDGTYTVDAPYRSPGGNDAIAVTMTIENDTVTAISTTYDASNDTSVNYQSRFNAAYTAEVVGKSLDTINLSRVGSASLTTGAFNDAVADIKNDARA